WEILRDVSLGDAKELDKAKYDAAIREVDQEIRQQNDTLAQRQKVYVDALVALKKCNDACPVPTAVEQPTLPGAEVFNGPPSETPTNITQPSLPTREVSGPPPSTPGAPPPNAFDTSFGPPPVLPCPECTGAYNAVMSARAALRQATPGMQFAALSALSRAQQDLRLCASSCKLPTETPPAVNPPPSACFGDTCGNDWNVCESNGSCRPIEDDCGVPGVCEDTVVNPTDGFTWTTSINIQIDIRIQDKVADLVDPGLYPQYSQQLPGFGSALVIPPATRQGVGQWFDPLGLLARRLVDHIDRWRGSVGPRPLIKARDLELIDRVSNVQAAGLPKGVHVLLTDQGGSTGRTLVMNVLNLTGQPVRLSSKPFAVQPIQPQA